MARKTVKNRRVVNTCGPEDRYVVAIGKIVAMIPRDVNSKTGESYRGCWENSYRQDQPAVRKEFYSLLVGEKHPMAEKFVDGCAWDTPCGNCARCFYEACRDEAENQGLIVKVPSKSGVKLFTPDEAATFKTRERRSYAPTKLTEAIMKSL